MRNIFLIIAYDGKNYFGWQKTRYGRSIQETLEQSLQQILTEPISLQAASRTDRGVHSFGQVANFYTSSFIDINKLKYALNRILPKDIAIRDIDEKSMLSHPSLHSIKKQYLYHLSFNQYQLPKDRNYVWHYPYPLDITIIKRASKDLLGHHNFASFANKKAKNPFCILFSIEILSPNSSDIIFNIIGDKFLYKMVRNIVGTLAFIGSKRMDKDIIPNLLKSQSRKHIGMTAPAHGLTLQKVFYS